MSIQNVVFDIGNVMVRWSPQEIIRLTFSERVDIDDTVQKIFRNELWLDLNKGLLSESEARVKYAEQFELTEQAVDALFYYIKHTQIPLHGSIELLQRVKVAGYGVYALTDNVREIVAHLQVSYDFWSLFDGAVISAEAGCLKPLPKIYQILCDRYQLEPAETVFLDDTPRNVKGAIAFGMRAIQFECAEIAAKDLRELGLEI